MTPDARASLLEAFMQHAAKATEEAKRLKSFKLDDPLADEKIKAMACGLSDDASHLMGLACAATRVSDEGEEGAEPIMSSGVTLILG